MYRIFRHYIPTTLLLLGVAETLILLVSVLIGVTLSVSGLLPNGTEFPSPGLISVQAVVFWLAILLGMIAMGLYQRDLRDAPLATLTRLAVSRFG